MRSAGGRCAAVRHVCPARHPDFIAGYGYRQRALQVVERTGPRPAWSPWSADAGIHTKHVGQRRSNLQDGESGEQGETVACGGVALEPDRSVGSLCWGIVHHGYQRRGLGRLMALARMQALADMPGCTSVRLETISPTVGFFAALGFSAVTTTVDGYERGIDWVEMELVFDDDVRTLLRSRLETQQAVVVT